jgi:polyvinyl alcohol dehydrogenase (cytochrome)
VTVCVAAFVAAMRGQSLDGRQVFADRCASCHSGAAETRAPALEALRSRSPEALIEVLVNGAMRPQGSRMSGAERRAVAEFIAGRPMSGDVSGSSTGRCGALAATRDIGAGPRWAGWSPGPTNTRFQAREQAGLTSADLKRLTLKWAFGFPDASSAWAQPTVASGRLFVGSQNGTVYSLDTSSGCIRWTFAAGGGVRTAIAIAGQGEKSVAYFGDTAANAYALDANTGKLLWQRKVEDHPLARVTGSPVVNGSRVYVPVSSYEESQGADAQYACCTFRGSVSALDAATGASVWKTYMIPDAPKPRGTSTAGVTLWGPAGSAIWSAPAIDEKRGALYVATGNAYSAPAHPSSDAVVALDLNTGRVRWQRQMTPDDVYLTGCRAGNPNCPAANGPDFDFGSPPMLVSGAGGRDLIVIAQKSGVAYALDPEKSGTVWQYRAGRGSVLGGIEWGAATDGVRAYFAVSDITLPQPGGLHAVTLATGERAWLAPPAPPRCGTGRGCTAAQSAAVTAIDGAVLSGSVDGVLRAYASSDGAVIWELDTNRDFATVNGVPAKGASMIGPGPVVAGGMVFVTSGYGAFLGRPGNVLLALAP